MVIYGLFSPIPWNSERVSMFHYVMFHGQGNREGVQWPEMPWAWYHNTLRTPLEIRRNGTFVPPVFLCKHLVVRRDVADALRCFSGFDLLQVKFTKLIDYPVEVGDFSYRDTVPCDPDRPDDLLDILPDVPALHESIDAFYEVIGTLPSHVLERYDNVYHLEVYPISDPPHYVDEDISPNMFRDYPVVGIRPILIREDVFDVLQPHLNMDLFHWFPIEI